MKMEPNTPVRIKGTVGAVRKGTAQTATRFVETVADGTIGDYLGPMTGSIGREGWHIIAVRIDGEELDVPLHESEFEPAANA